MFAILLLLGLPFFLRNTVPRIASGLDPSLGEIGASFGKFKGAAAKGAGAGAGFLATPQGQAAASMALGPAGGALLASPQGQQAVARGAKLARSAKKGNPKAKRRIALTKAKARAGDPKAKKELVAIDAGNKLDEAAQAEEFDGEESEEEEE